MTQYVIKIVLSAVIITVVSEIGKRSALLGGIVVSLPLVSLLSLIWLWGETKDVERVSTFCWSVFWLVLPSLALFAAIPLLMKRGVAFPAALAGSILLMVACYLVFVAGARRFGLTV